MPQDAAGELLRFDDFDEIRKALYHPALSRTLDRRSFEEGNPRAGILSLLHGDEHRDRRRLENPLFRRAALVEYEQVLFPKILAEVLDRGAVGAVDLFDLAGSVTVVLAAIILDEPIRAAQIVGGVVIVVGVLLTRSRPSGWGGRRRGVSAAVP